MKRVIQFQLSFAFLVFTACTSRTDRWQPAEFTLTTPWSLEVPVETPWPEYPRPMMQREEWVNLNGLWDYALMGRQTDFPEIWHGTIRVPFPIESALSGVRQMVNDTTLLWYRRSFTVPDEWKGKSVLLHFEASDWETRVWVNGQEAGMHRGGYDPFSFDITGMLNPGIAQELIVSVWDPTDKGSQPRGKQVNEPGGIFYTPSTGIWQTVWIEPVPETYILDYRLQTDIDRETIEMEVQTAGNRQGLSFTTRAYSQGNLLAEAHSGQPALSLSLPGSRLWSPDDPFLYDLEIVLTRNGTLMDSVRGYFGMRKISPGKDDQGYTRMLLNNAFVFQNGPLDQGFWPDGLYTPPSDEAMRYDIEMTKKMGFNMLRKHVKVEPRRFYYWCDMLGILVWQDMPSTSGFVGYTDPDLEVGEEHASQFTWELERMIQTKFNHPSVIVWVPFNEGWGQHRTAWYTGYIKSLDPTRLVNPASGWTDRGTGDILDIHHYPDPRMPEPEKNRAIVLGEFGGLGYGEDGHTWQKENWGYRNMRDKESLLETFEDFYSTVWDFASKGLSAAVYTQTTDVETETNGLITYDRKVLKMEPQWVSKAVKGILPPVAEGDQRIFMDEVNVKLSVPLPEVRIFYTTDGTSPGENSLTYKGEFTLTESAIVKAIAVYEDGEKSRIRSFEFLKAIPVPGSTEKPADEGLRRQVYEGNWRTLPDFDTLSPVQSDVSSMVGIASLKREQHYGVVWEGVLYIAEEDVYRFSLTSDDGSRLFLHGEMLINNDGVHGMVRVNGYKALGKGYHPVRIEYFQRTGGQGLEFYISGTGAGKKPVDMNGIFFHH